MKLHSILATVGVIIALLHTTVSACPPQPPLKAGDDGTASGIVGQTLTFSGLNKFYCPDGGQIVEYRWVLPPQAYHAEGDNTSEVRCKFSPAGTYEVELQVKCSHGLWNTDHLNYPNGNRYVYVVAVSPVAGPWYVKPDGSDADDGQSWATAFRTIQTAIDSAVAGQEIIVASGTAENQAIYYEQLDLKGKSLTIRSDDPDNWEAVENTILDAGQRGTAVLYRGTEAGELKGFTLTGGAPTGDGLAMHLAMDDEQEPGLDSSGKGRHGILHGTTWAPDGYHGGALSFDGIDDYIEIKGYPGVVGRNSRTVSAWIKTEAVTSSLMMIASWGSPVNGQRWMMAIDSGQAGQLIVGVSGGNIRGQLNVADGNWHHVAVVLEDDGSPDVNKIRLYVDGVLETNTTIGNCDGSRPIDTSSLETVILGARTDGEGYSNHYQGLLDDVRIYSRAMNGGEIAELAAMKYPVVQLTMDDISGGYTSDFSGNSFHGEVFGAIVENNGYLNAALRFTGDDYVALPSRIINPGGMTFSAFAWVRLEGPNSSNQVILQQTDAINGPGRAWLYRDSDNRLCSNLGNIKMSSNNAVFSSGLQWYHVGITYDGQTVRLYANGQLCGSGNREAEECNGNLLIGTHKTFNSLNFWNGLIDELRIYRRVLSPSEIGILADNHPSLVSYLKFDEEINGITPDSAGANNGVLKRGGQIVSNGKFGNACSFNGIDEVVYLSGSGTYSQYSVSFWFNSTAESQSKYLFRDNYGSYNYGRPDIRLHGDELFASGGHDYYGYVRGESEVSAGRCYTNGQWHHVIATFSSMTNTVELYVNGDYVGQKKDYPVYSLSIDNGSNIDTRVELGGSTRRSSYSPVIIDEFKLFSKVLAPDEVSILSSIGGQRQEKGLLVHYKLQGDANDSAGDYDGTVYGCQQEAGLFGTALKFNGIDDYVDLPNVFDPAEGPFSMFGWVRLDQKQGSIAQIIFQQYDSPDGGMGRALLWRNHQDHLCSSLAYSSLGYDVTVSEHPVFSELGQWLHVGMTYEHTTLKLYVNGKMVASNVKAIPPHSAGMLCLGQHKNPTEPSVRAPWNGAMDDIRIYNYALSEREIIELYSFGEGGGVCGNGASPIISKCIVKNNLSQSNGGGLSGINGTITHCFILNNESAADGGGLAHCHGDIINCVIAGNRALSGGGGLSNCNGNIINNTIVNNSAIASGGGLRDCSGVIVNSIIWANTPNAFWACSSPSYSCFPGGSGNNSDQEPFFLDIEKIAGGDGFLGTIDDGLQLKGIASPCYNTGSVIAASAIQIDMLGEPRSYSGNVDMGAYELRYVEVPNVVTLSLPGAESVLNHQIGLTSSVVEIHSEEPPGYVLNQYPHGNGVFVQLLSNVELIVSLGQDTTPPSPNPMIWEVEPVIVGDGTIVTMTAAVAEDDSGVEYFFEETTGNFGGNNSGWRDSPVYTNYGLIIGNQYTYRVKARDKSMNQNETGFSSEKTVVPFIADSSPPVSGTMSFETLPYVATWNSISMKALPLGDSGSVEYYFQEMTGNVGGSDSGWQVDPEYRDFNLLAGHTYSYRVKARNTGFQQSETLWSDVYHVVFSPSSQLTDQVPPTPNPMTWSIHPTSISNRSLMMKATPATDNMTSPNKIEYYFDCVSGGGQPSGWQQDFVYIDWKLHPNIEYTYRVKARDEAGNETAWSEVSSAILEAQYVQDVRFTVQDVGQGRVRIGYENCPIHPVELRSIALNVTLQNAVIQSPSDVLFVDSRFNCFMDYAVAYPEYTFGSGHPLAAVEQAGVPDFNNGGLDEVCINMARFDINGAALPGPQKCNNLITIQLHQDLPEPAIITIRPDSLRKASFVNDERLTNLPISTTISFE